jgi:hypothetical protein
MSRLNAAVNLSEDVGAGGLSVPEVVHAPAAMSTTIEQVMSMFFMAALLRVSTSQPRLLQIEGMMEIA